MAHFEQPSCPFPIHDYPQVVMAHGGGGRLGRDLVRKLLLEVLGDCALAQDTDSALIELGAGKVAMTTDSHVVSPLFFPGGDIGSLAVYGTVNDLAMVGALPRYLSLALILEEGFSMYDLRRIARSIATAASECGVKIATGDTKVVDRGKGDGIYINTAGVGVVATPLRIEPAAIRTGDLLIVSSDLARHGMAVMASREGFEFESRIRSDCRELSSSVQALLDAGVEAHCLRDLTRGGLGSALVEIAETAGADIVLEERLIPVGPEARAACEIIGMDPMFVANEGCFVAFVPEADAHLALNVLKGKPGNENAAIIGRVASMDRGRVSAKTLFGSNRLITMLSGEQLPRIC